MIRERSYDREIGALAIPALGSLIADPLLSLVDTGFVGSIGTEALGALGVASALFAIAFFMFNFLEYGTTTVVARALGAGDREAAGRSVMTSLAMALIAGSGATVVLLVTRGWAVGALGADGDVASAAIAYIGVRAFAAPAVLVVRAAHGAYRGFHDTRTPFIVTLFINGINLVLDPVLILGFDWGVEGAAWATVIAQWIGAAVFLALFWRGRRRFGLVGARPVRSETRSFLVVGRDLAIRTAALLAAFTLTTAVAARISEEAIAAHQVVMQVFIFVALALDALAIAAQAMVGRRVGAGDVAEATRVSDRLLVLGIGFGLIAAAVLAVLAPWLPGWFAHDPEVLDVMAEAYWLMLALQPLAAVAFVWDGVFIGAGDFGYLAAAMVVAALVTGAVLVAVIPLGLGLPGVWAAVGVLLAVRVVTLAWRRASRKGPFARDRAPGSPAAG